jgi:hypothetical protein
MGQHDAQPEQNNDDQLVVNEVWYHGMALFHGGERGPFYPVFERSELSAELGYTTLCLENETTAIQEFEDCIQCFLTDWKAKADKIRLS